MAGERFDIEDENCEDFVRSFYDVNNFRNSFRKKYEFIIAYHATNISDVEIFNIRKVGLRRTTIDLLLNKAKARFVTEDCKNKKEIEKEIHKYFLENEPHTVNEINFGLVKDDLFECYHYLLFGSEALLPIADYLKTKFSQNFRNLLIEFGSHCIIQAIVPVEQIDNCEIDSIYDYFHQHSFSISLVYNYDLTGINIINIEKVDRPTDSQNLLFI